MKFVAYFNFDDVIKVVLVGIMFWFFERKNIEKMIQILTSSILPIIFFETVFRENIISRKLYLRNSGDLNRVENSLWSVLFGSTVYPEEGQNIKGFNCDQTIKGALKELFKLW